MPNQTDYHTKLLTITSTNACAVRQKNITEWVIQVGLTSEDIHVAWTYITFKNEATASLVALSFPGIFERTS